MASKRILFSGSSAAQRQASAALIPASPDEGAYEELPLSRITPDQDNPRRLGLDMQDPRNIDSADPRAEEKRAELEELENMALSIASQGVITPIRVYRFGQDFRIAHGERRFLASVLAGKGVIPAIVLRERPRNLRVQQLIENFQRKGLNLHRRVQNISDVIAEGASLGTPVVTGDDLRRLTGLGKTQASKYLLVINAPADVLDAVAKGRITDLTIAAEVAKITDPILRDRAIKDADPAAVADIRATAKPTPTRARAGRPMHVRLGSVKHTDVARRLIEAVAGQGTYDIDWTDPSTVTKAFKKLIKDMEEGKL